MFTNNKRVVPIKASPTYESRSGTSNGQTKGNKDSNAGLPMVELTNHDDADQFELQMNIEMDKFNEHMHAEDDKIRANLKAPQNLGALGGIKSGRVGPGGNLDSSRIDTDILEPDQGQSVEEADEGEEEVLLAHDMPGAGAKATESLRKAFSAMKLQVEEFQRRTQQAMDERSEMQKRVFELEDKIDMQEDEVCDSIITIACAVLLQIMHFCLYVPNNVLPSNS